MGNKVKFCCAIYIGDFGINVFSNHRKLYEKLRQGSFVHHIPRYRCEPVKARSDLSIVYVDQRAISVRMLANNKAVEIRCPLRKVLAASTIPYRAHFMLEMQLQQHGICTSQGAGVSKNGQGILLMGKRGSGKTSITLRLCLKYQYRLIGNDIVLLGYNEDGGFLYGGTEVFTLRRTTVKHHNRELQKYFGKPGGVDDWTDKRDVFPQDLGLQVERSFPVNIAKAFYVHLDNDPRSPVRIQKIGEGNTQYMGKLFLYEAFSRYIRGNCIPAVIGRRFDVAGYLPSLDSKNYHHNRVKLINWLIDTLGFYYISGSMDNICRYLDAGMDASSR